LAPRPTNSVRLKVLLSRGLGDEVSGSAVAVRACCRSRRSSPGDGDVHGRPGRDGAGGSVERGAATTTRVTVVGRRVVVPRLLTATVKLTAWPRWGAGTRSTDPERRAQPRHPHRGPGGELTVAVNNRGTTDAPANTVTRVVVAAPRSTEPPAPSRPGDVNVAIPGTWTAVNGNTTLTATATPEPRHRDQRDQQHLHPHAVSWGRGANVPWDEYEAEAGTFTGTLETGTWAEGTLSGEASGRKGRHLTVRASPCSGPAA